jgi:TPR repeat protein
MLTAVRPVRFPRVPGELPPPTRDLGGSRRAWAWCAALLALVVLLLPGSREADACEKVDGECFCSCPANQRLNKKDCECEAVVSTGCTLTCGAGQQLDKKACKCQAVVSTGCTLTCGAGQQLDTKACTCVADGPARCTRACGADERLDPSACTCIPVPRVCTATCAPCEVLNAEACRCGPKPANELPACQERHCGPNQPAYCDALVERAKRESDELRRMRLLERACDGGHGRACFELAELRSASGANDDELRIGYLEKACEAGHKPACAKLAETLEGAKAVEYYGKACDPSHPEVPDTTACRRYGEGLRASNPSRARSILDATCAAGDVLACSQLGRMAERGEGGPRDMVRARAAYRASCFPSRGDGRFDASACHEVGRLAGLAGERTEARNAFRRGCDALPPSLASCEALGDVELAAAAPKAAKPRFEKACADGRSEGSPSACRKLGALLDERTAGNSSGLEEARQRYDQACRRGQKEACTKSEEIARLFADDDRDAVINLDDRCRSEPEDKDGYSDGDGCPEKDNDDDGFLDGSDACPDRAESKNDFEDEDGCPEGTVDFEVSCDGSSVASSDLSVLVDGDVAERRHGSVVLSKGTHKVAVWSSGCETKTLSVDVSPGDSPTYELELKKTALAALFTGTPSDADLPSAGDAWSLDLAYSYLALPQDLVLSRTPETADDGPASRVGLVGSNGLHGFALHVGPLFKYAVLGLEAGFATASGLEVRGIAGQATDPDSSAFPGASASVSVYRLPGVRLGGRFPFGRFALSGGGSFGVEHWRIDGEVGSMPGLTLMTLEPWAELQAKLTCDLGVNVRGGYRYGLSTGPSDPFNYGYVQSGLVLQPCDTSKLDRSDDSPPSFTRAFRFSYQQVFLRRGAALTDGDYGLTLAGAPMLRGLVVEFGPALSKYASMYAGIGLAHASEVPVVRYVPEPQYDSEDSPIENSTTSLTLWTLPSSRLEFHLPFKRLTLDAGGSFDLAIWKASIASSSDRSNLVITTGPLLGATFRPACTLGLHVHGGYKWGLLGDGDGYDFGYLTAGMSYRVCN